MRVLFSEDERYYRMLGLTDLDEVEFVFGGMRFYKRSNKFYSQFSAFVCAFYTLPHNTIMTLRFRSLGVKTILFSDGIFDFSNALKNPMHTKYKLFQFHPIIQNYFVCVGASEANYFSMDSISMDYVPARMIDSSPRLEAADFQKILITTANTAYYSSEEFDSLVRMISELVHFFERRDIRFGVRLFDERLINELDKHLCILGKNDVAESFESTISRYSAVITTPSSVAVSSMYHRRPTALLVYRDLPMTLQAGWIVPNVELFLRNFDDFSPYNTERMKIQQRLLLNYSESVTINDRIKEIISDDCSQVKEFEFFVNQALVNMLSSRFNINFEWTARKLYRFLINKRILRTLLAKIRLFIV